MQCSTEFLSKFSLDTLVEVLWTAFKAKCSECLELIPQTVFSKNHFKAPWINARIRQLSKRKKRAYNRAWSNKFPLGWSKYWNLKKNYKLLEWTKDFSTNRTQQVVLNNITSESVKVLSGVPQGSVLGPLLFLLYINDPPLSVLSKVKFYADGTLIYALQTRLTPSELFCRET